MSRLEDLLQTLCPDGVEYLWLSEIEDKGYITLGRGNVISKQDLASFPGEFPVYSSSAMGVGEFGRYGKYMFDDERISWSVDGGGRFFYRPPHKYSITNVSGWLAVNDKSRIVIKYLFYVLENEWSKKKFDYIKKAHPSVIRKEYHLPLPPTPVQEEIVRILDTFSGVVTELEAEQAARVRQYEYYRNELLSFDSKSKMIEKIFADFSPNCVEFKKLGELCNITTGKLNANAMKDNGKYPFFTCAKEVYRIDKYAFDTEALLVSGNGSQVGHIHYYKGKFNAYQRTYVLDGFNENISFISHVLRAFLKQRILEEVNVSGVPYIKLDTLTEFLIPVPPQPMQEEIVRILDTFANLVTDLKSGLPAEITLRRKQYEYYRDKLLTFKPIQPPPGRGSAS